MGAYEFLSEEWIAGARDLKAEYEGRIPVIDPPVRINVVITDVPFRDEPLPAHVDTTDGELVLELGHLDEVPLTVTADYQTARSLFVDQDYEALVQAMLQGRIRIQGDLTPMMGLQQSPDHPLRQELSRRLGEMTR